MKEEGSFGNFGIENQRDVGRNPNVEADRVELAMANEALRRVMAADAIEAAEQEFEPSMKNFTVKLHAMHDEMRKEILKRDISH